MVKQITSVANDTIVEYSKLSSVKARCSTGLFIVEGEKALLDIINSDIQIKDIFVSEDYDYSKLSENMVTVVSEPVMKKLSSSDNPPKVITVAYQRNLDMFDLKGLNRLLLLDGISDPGNMGTIIRLAAGFNYDGILLYGNCVDPYNPKVIRSAAGNFFKIPFATVANDFSLKEYRKYFTVMTDLHDLQSLKPEEIPLEEPFILVFGSEANGISKEILDIPHYNTKIPMQNIESFNVATSAAIIMYEFQKKY
jgi:TrmH family RNA methyltransferase